MEQAEIKFEEEKSAFEIYDEQHPQIWKAFERFTFEAMKRGFKNYGAKSIIELIRWHTGVNAEFPEGFKISNNHAPDYARKFMRVHPEHDGYFRIKKLRKHRDKREQKSH